VSATEGARARNPQTFENNTTLPTPHPHPNQNKKALGGEQGPPHFGLRDRTLFQNGEKRFTLLQEDLQNSLRETRSQPASQPASQPRQNGQEPRQRETERKIKAHFGFGLREGRPTSVTGSTYRKPKWVIVSFHFPPTRYPSGPAKDNT